MKFKSDLEKINELKVTKKQLEREYQQLSKNVGEVSEDHVDELQEKMSKFRSEVEMLTEKREKLEEEKRNTRARKTQLEEELKTIAQEIGGMETDLNVRWKESYSNSLSEKKKQRKNWTEKLRTS